MTNLRCLLLSTVLLAIAPCALATPPAQAAAQCRPQLREGWVRLGPAGMPMMAGFGRIENHCPAPVTITAASSPAFDGAQLHETRMVDGVNRMRQLHELRIPPGGVAVLKPGGMHLMLMKPHAPLKPGSRVVVSFALAGGGELLGEFEVRRPDAL